MGKNAAGLGSTGQDSSVVYWTLPHPLSLFTQTRTHDTHSLTCTGTLDDPGNVDDINGCWDDPHRADRLAESGERAVGHQRGSVVRIDGAKWKVGGFRSSPPKHRIEEGRLANIRKADQPGLKPPLLSMHECRCGR
jgi:hypothetical protein